uniref:Zn(2)-C6 fungal-type domain-containing protein n=1 Tax=Ganoderma boninense TaxID=34458 RepID=A0A5K1K378_9APHY|nr:Zn(2)-C6 fungal-type domain-containing protein [Ganoderma boninense]
MARFSTLLALCMAAAAASASPVVVRDSPISLPLARRFKSTGVGAILAADRARAEVLKNVGLAKGGNASKRANLVVSNANTYYAAEVGIGSPATTYTLLVDTGSANTFVGAGKAYVQTSTSQDTGNTVSVSYGSGSFSGEQYTDSVTLGDITITNQGISDATQSSGFSGIDGILGVGPADLTQGTVSDGNVVPTVTDNAYSQGLIGAEVLGISFLPASSGSDVSGTLDFGGADSSKYSGDLNYVSITGTSPASNYVGIDQSITYGQDTEILSTTAGIVDTGTTLLLLATDAFDAYQQATGGEMDSTTGLLKISSSQYDNLQSLFFTIGSQTYEFTANAQIWPRSLNSVLGGDSNSIYLVASDLGSNSGQGLDFINGYSWIERFYVAYDVTNSQVGFATTDSTESREVLLGELRASLRALSLWGYTEETRIYHPAALETFLPHIASSLENLQLDDFVVDPEEFQAWGVSPAPAYTKTQYPMVRSLSMHLYGAPLLEHLQHLFPALDGTLSFIEFQRSNDDIMGNPADIRSANERAQEASSSRPWKELDCILCEPQTLYLLGLRCPVKQVVLRAMDVPLEPYAVDALRENPVPRLKLVLRHQSSFVSLCTPELATTLTHLTLVLVYPFQTL